MPVKPNQRPLWQIGACLTGPQASAKLKGIWFNGRVWLALSPQTRAVSEALASRVSVIVLVKRFTATSYLIYCHGRFVLCPMSHVRGAKAEQSSMRIEILQSGRWAPLTFAFLSKDLTVCVLKMAMFSWHGKTEIDGPYMHVAASCQALEL